MGVRVREGECRGETVRERGKWLFLSDLFRSPSPWWCPLCIIAVQVLGFIRYDLYVWLWMLRLICLTCGVTYSVPWLFSAESLGAMSETLRCPTSKNADCTLLVYVHLLLIAFIFGFIFHAIGVFYCTVSILVFSFICSNSLAYGAPPQTPRGLRPIRTNLSEY